MTTETLRHFFAWCAVINYAMLIVWFVLHLVAHGWLTGLSQRFFRVSADRYDSITLKAMFYFKLSIWLLNIGPYLALRIIG